MVTGEINVYRYRKPHLLKRGIYIVGDVYPHGFIIRSIAHNETLFGINKGTHKLGFDVNKNVLILYDQDFNKLAESDVEVMSSEKRIRRHKLCLWFYKEMEKISNFKYTVRNKTALIVGAGQEWGYLSSFIVDVYKRHRLTQITEFLKK